ncbi:MAG: efflux transporter outer membrane subunit [Rhodanobacter sp.]
MIRLSLKLNRCAVLSLGAWTFLAGCSLEPHYTVPDVAASSAFKEASVITPQEAGTWEKASPAESVPRGEWWKVFNDPQLDSYESEARAANQNLKAAAARVEEVRAFQQTARSQEFPSTGVGFGPARQLNSPDSLGVPPGTVIEPQNVWRAQASISYEVDLFGRVSSTVHAAKADAEQSEALFRSVQLALEGDVAQNYFSLRELDGELDVLGKTVVLRQEALDFVQHRFDAGDVSELDMAQAKAELESARSDAMTLTRQRSVSEHSLAVLLGRAPAELTVKAHPIEAVTIKIPPGLPSSLLERRPDISAAERAMAAANARVGIARAAFFPSLMLTGIGGYESSTLSNLFNWSSRSFLLGPLVGTPLNMPLFDGGLRKGNLANARARYEEQVAFYRQQVLVAFREVEDSLANVRILRDQTEVEDSAVQASARAAQLSRTQYEDGQVNYLDVIESERTLLQTRRAAMQLDGAQAVSTVNLIRALGGGWRDTPADSAVASVAASKNLSIAGRK